MTGSDHDFRPQSASARSVGTVAYFTPQSGERDRVGAACGERGLPQGAQMYWQRIPDFGIERFRIYPSETGWVQVVYWGGTEGPMTGE